LRSPARVPPACSYWLESGPKKARMPPRARARGGLVEGLALPRAAAGRVIGTRFVRR
jgi:hypothetical protein